MNVDLMRTIDRRAGVPLAFLLTLARRTAGLLHRPAPQRPKKILFVELSEMGSTILADPAMRKASETFAADLYFVIFQKNRASLDLIGTIDPARTFTIRENSLLNLTVDTARFLFWVRRQRIDTVIDLELFSRFTALLTGLSGAVNRVGFYNFYNEGLYRGELLSHRVAYNPHIHIAKNFIALVNSLIAADREVPYSKQPVADEEIRLPVIHYGEKELQGMREQVRHRYPEYDRHAHRLVLINPNASELLPQRRWMPERYLELIQRILQASPDILVLITGAPAETAEAKAMCKKTRPAAMPQLCRRPETGRIAPLVLHCRVHGHQRFRAGPFFSHNPPADLCSFRPGNPETLRLPWQQHSHLRRTGLLPLCQCGQPSQDPVPGQQMFAGHYG